MNATWHQQHVMPKNPTLEQRLSWHAEHAEACGCRSMPPKLAALLKQRQPGAGVAKPGVAKPTVAKPRARPTRRRPTAR